MTNPQAPDNIYLSFVRMNIYFNEQNTYEVDSHDIYELCSRLDINCNNVVIIKKNSFFLLFNTTEDSIRIFKKLNNYFIQKLQARIEIQLCVQGEKSSFQQPTEEYKALFEIEVPEFQKFNVERRFFGVNGYNFERLKNLSNKEFFEGDIDIEYQGVDRERRNECKLIRWGRVYDEYIKGTY